MKTDTLKNENCNNQENDFVDAVKGTLVSAGIFLVIFVLATVVDLIQ
ncbi:MAG: YqzM family protein [Thermoactinomyces sp.]